MSLTLASDALEVLVYPEQGFLIGQIRSLAAGHDLLWTQPPAEAFSGKLGPRGESSVDSFHRSFPEGGSGCSRPQASQGGSRTSHTWHHGEAARLPWRVMGPSDGTRIRAEILLRDDRLKLVRVLRLHRETLTVSSRVTNIGRTPIAWSAGEHPCFDRKAFAGGRILLESCESWIPAPHYDPRHALLSASARFEWPHAPAVNGYRLDLSEVPHFRSRRHEHVALSLGSREILLRSPKLGINVRLTIDEGLPYALLWEYFDDQKT